MGRQRPHSAPDPGRIFFEKAGIASTTPYTDVSSKTARSLTINPAERTLVMICAGQSLVTSIITDTYSPVNASKIDNFAWYDGTNWAAANPVIGTAWNGSVATSHNFNLKIADGLISNGKFNRVIMIPCGMAGTTINLWVNDYTTEPTGYYRCILAAANKLAARGVTPSTTGVKFLIKWNQGESDTSAATSQASYAADFAKLKTLCATLLPGAKWTVAKETWITGAVSANVQAAQVAAVDNVTVFSGENMDSLDATYRVGDNTHLNASGGVAAAAMGIAAINAITF